MVHANRLRMCEVPVSMYERGGGVSSINGTGKSTYYMVKVLLGAAGGPRARGAPVSSPETTRRWPPRTGSDGRAHTGRRHPRRRRADRRAARARAAAPAARALRAAVAVQRLRAARRWRSGAACSRTSRAASASPTRRTRCSWSRSASCWCCCCTSRWPSRGCPSRRRCSRSDWRCSRSEVAGAGEADSAAEREARRARISASRASARGTGEPVAVVVVTHESAAIVGETLSALVRQLRRGRRARRRGQRVPTDDRRRCGLGAAARFLEQERNRGFAGRRHVGAAASRRRCCSSSTPTRCRRRAASTRSARRPSADWGAWQALVHDGRAASDQHARRGTALPRHGLGGPVRASRLPPRRASRRRSGSPRARRWRSGESAWDAHRRLRPALLHVRRGRRRLAAAAAWRAGASASSRPRGWSTTTSSTRAATSGSTSSATAGGR